MFSSSRSLCEKDIHIIRNDDVIRIIAFIPPGHHHTRLLIELGDRVLVLQEATVSALVRAYVNVALHPTRKVYECLTKTMSKKEKKLGFARIQLLETNRTEEEVLNEIKCVIDKLFSSKNNSNLRSG